MSYPNPPRTDHPQKLLILIVEDFRLFTRAIKDALPHYQFITAKTVEEAKVLYEKELPDIVFLDINLPDGSGHDVLKYIRSIDPHAFVVMLTSSSAQEDVKKAVSNGARGYVLKPFNRGRIQQYIDQYVAEHQQLVDQSLKDLPSSPLPPSPLPTQENAPPKNALQELLEKYPILFVNAYEANLFNTQRSLEEVGYIIYIARNAEEALQMIKEHNCPIVVIDCELPETDGYFLCSRIRQHDRIHKQQRIIIGLGIEGRSDQKRWLVAGMNDYYAKPFPIKSLASVLMKFVRFLSEEEPS